MSETTYGMNDDEFQEKVKEIEKEIGRKLTNKEKNELRKVAE